MAADFNPTQSDYARALRAKDWSYGAIARELGVGKGTVHRWVNPESDERSRVAARAWKERHPSTCNLCGAPKHHNPDSGRCQACVLSMADTRDSLLVGMWEDGWTYSEIARAMGWKDYHTTGVELTRLRRKGLIGYRQPDHWRVAA